MQSVNLYVPELRPKKDPLCAEYSVAGVLVLIVMILGLYGFESSALKDQKEKLDRLEAKLSGLKVEASKLKKKPAADLKINLEQEIAATRKSIKNRLQIEDLLTGKNMGNTKGFAPYFFDLSQQTPDSVSIRRVSIFESGARAGINGVSSSASDIPLLVNRLQATQSFSKTTFGKMIIWQSNGYQKFAIGRVKDKKSVSILEEI